MSEPTKKEIVSIVDAQAKSIDTISERLVKIENLVEKQDSKNQNVLYAVLIAFVLLVGSIAVEVIVSNKSDKQYYSSIEKDIREQISNTQELNNKLDNLKARNPYLK
jgi:septal ring factor EnvC (AmiA/AmiB activator)